jgi:AAA15 family ATPase/GTPase
MNGIGFTNFRKFKSFSQVNFGGITFLVGPNNAGKSTLVKALLLLNNYFKSKEATKFHFGNSVLESANIITYGRAKNVEADENRITFSYVDGDSLVKMKLTGVDEMPFAEVEYLMISSLNSPIFYEFDLIHGTCDITLSGKQRVNAEQVDLKAKLKALLKNIEDEIKNLSSSKSSKEYIELQSEKAKLEEKIAGLGKEIVVSNACLNGESFLEMDSLADVIFTMVEDAKSEYEGKYIKVSQGEDEPFGFEDLKAFKDYGFDNVIDEFIEIIKKFASTSYIYFGASTMKQSALFRIRDKENALAQAIHEFFQLRIQPGEYEHLFVKKWMNNLDIGDDFDIKLYGGEAYEMKIKTGNQVTPLADKGMGSIQAMSLILKIACAIRGSKKLDESGDNHQINTTTIIIEEPELNLHPALQSKLADLFLDVHSNYPINFLIETHSEYLIRKTQLLVKQNEFEVEPNTNPFTVLYFDKELKQWVMNYREDGKFIDDFGPGFFDETRNIVKQMI